MEAGWLRQQRRRQDDIRMVIPRLIFVSIVNTLRLINKKPLDKKHGPSESISYIFSQPLGSEIHFLRRPRKHWRHVQIQGAPRNQKTWTVAPQRGPLCVHIYYVYWRSCVFVVLVLPWPNSWYTPFSNDVSYLGHQKSKNAGSSKTTQFAMYALYKFDPALACAASGRLCALRNFSIQGPKRP